MKRVCPLGLLLSASANVTAATYASEEWLRLWLQNYAAIQTNSSSNSANPLWDATCTSGATSNPLGCLGNIGSTEFAVLNVALGDFLSFSNLASDQDSTPNSVFIKQFSGTVNQPVNNYITVDVTQVMAAYVVCGLFTSKGINFSQAINNAPVMQRSTTYNQPTQFIVRYFTNTLTAINPPLVWGRYAVNEPGTQLQTTFYLLCIGTTATPPYDPAPIVGILAD